MKRSRVILLAALVASVCIVSCNGAGEWRRASGSVWGTVYHITYKSDRDLSDTITAEMARVDMSLSPFNKNSVISAVNAGSDVVDSLFYDVFELSKRVNVASGGMFDPTVAPLINLWGFGYKQGASDVPDDAAIDSALMCVGIGDCSISAGRLARKHPRTEFNFSAVAKGYGVDRVAAALLRNGCNDFMVEIGGEVSLCGDGPRGDGWCIQIDAPVDDLAGSTHLNLSRIQGSDMGIATSGNYRNYRVTSQGRAGHTISPVSGHPVATEVLSVTVTAPTVAEADALATAAMAMNKADAFKMIEAWPGAEALLVTLRPDSAYNIERTKGFPSAR